MARSLVGFKADIPAARRLGEALDTIEPLQASAQVLVTAVKRRLASAGHGGRAYRARGKAFTAAAPGQAPAHQSGALEEGIGQRLLPQRRLKSRERIRVGTFDESAAALEFGFITSAALGPARDGIQPHPFMRPALAEAKAQMRSAFKISVKWKGTRTARQRMTAYRARQAAIRPGLNPAQQARSIRSLKGHARRRARLAARKARR